MPDRSEDIEAYPDPASQKDRHHHVTLHPSLVRHASAAVEAVRFTKPED